MKVNQWTRRKDGSTYLKREFNPVPDVVLAISETVDGHFVCWKMVNGQYVYDDQYFNRLSKAKLRAFRFLREPIEQKEGETMEAQLIKTLAEVIQFAVGNREPRHGNPYGPTVLAALEVLKKATGFQGHYTDAASDQNPALRTPEGTGDLEQLALNEWGTWNMRLGQQYGSLVDVTIRDGHDEVEYSLDLGEIDRTIAWLLQARAAIARRDEIA